MSDVETREKRSKRFYADEVCVQRRKKLLKELNSSLDSSTDKQPHRLHKVSGMNCGNPKCVMCMNPRKAWKELSTQEQSFYQEKLWDDDGRISGV